MSVYTQEINCCRQGDQNLYKEIFIAINFFSLKCSFKCITTSNNNLEVVL